LHTRVDVPKAPLNPPHPERTCWGCNRYCPADSLACGNGTIRTMHPVELFGEDWLEWSTRRTAAIDSAVDAVAPGVSPASARDEAP